MLPNGKCLGLCECVPALNLNRRGSCSHAGPGPDHASCRLARREEDSAGGPFLAYGATLSALALAGGPGPGRPSCGKVAFSSNPFTLGVASGDPASTGVVLWTRLALDLVPGEGCRPSRSRCSGKSPMTRR